MQKTVVDKIKISLFMLVFFLALMLSNNKPNLNYISKEQIAKEIRGIGAVKSSHIVTEKENGLFKNKKDFYDRIVMNGKYKIGDVVFERITKTYNIEE